MKKHKELIQSIGAFLEKNGAISVSSCKSGGDVFDVIRSEQDPMAPVGVTFYGSRELAQSLANAFPAHKVMTASDGEIIEPAATASLKKTKSKSGLRPN